MGGTKFVIDCLLYLRHKRLRILATYIPGYGIGKPILLYKNENYRISLLDIFLDIFVWLWNINMPTFTFIRFFDKE